MRIGNLEVNNPIVLGPMAGVTDWAFRTICAEMGANITVTEMVSSRALVYKDQKSAALHYIHIRFGNSRCTRPAALDFRTGKLNTRFDLFQHDIIVQSLAVIGQLTVAVISFFAVSHLPYNFPRKGPAVWRNFSLCG